MDGEMKPDGTYEDGESDFTISAHTTNSDSDAPKRSTDTIQATDMNTITMEVTVDVSDMSDRDTEVCAKLAEIYERNFREVIAKNRDYGWSFLRTGCKLASTDGTPFDQPARSQAYGLLTRTGDKRERLLQNVYASGSPEVSDEPSQTAGEAGNYYFFLQFVLANPELAASFLDAE